MAFEKVYALTPFDNTPREWVELRMTRGYKWNVLIGCRVKMTISSLKTINLRVLLREERCFGKCCVETVSCLIFIYTRLFSKEIYNSENFSINQ